MDLLWMVAHIGTRTHPIIHETIQYVTFHIILFKHPTNKSKSYVQMRSHGAGVTEGRVWFRI